MIITSKFVSLALALCLAAGATAVMASPAPNSGLHQKGAVVAAEPTASPTAEPTASPTVEPTATPTTAPTATPAPEKQRGPQWKLAPTATPVPTGTVVAEPTADPSATPEPEATYANHGAYVSEVAHTTPPGPGHGQAVREAAHEDVGKAAKGTDDGDEPDEDEPPTVDDEEATPTASPVAEQSAAKGKPEAKGGHGKK